MIAPAHARPMEDVPPPRRRVGLIGCGSIGRAVAEQLVNGAVDGAELVGVVDNVPVVDAPASQVSLSVALEECDVLVECAGQVVVSQHAEQILRRGRDLLITSVGALADPELAQRLHRAGPGRLLFTSGAVGGVDLLAAAARNAPLRTVQVSTTKRPQALVQPWMDDASQERLLAATEPVEVFSGGAREASRWFPRSLNVAATVAFAVGDFDVVRVRLYADPHAELTSHVVEAEGPSGQYRFEIRNQPSPANPRTSGVVPFALLRSLAALVGRPGPIL
jgi:aspartate dehydrogenase